MSKSIIQEGRYCYQCGRENVPLEEHHCCNGNPGRKLSDKYGLTVYLCPQCHRNVHSEYGLREHLETIIDTAEDIAHELRRYKEDVV